ncbi:GntR family transcriptional regulator [Caproiciproducens galactitolivorans]|uniref:GntR family transcriptional regulator n=1 Tax=Caproiciproducens galactitolivorans TaxID=642589 RepID=UPI00240A97D6|nr:GntR family transcriptional regulator [Caproiciproducens galactitolivorans]
MFTLDYKSRLPIYEQLYKSITKMAALGAVDKDEPLPSVRVLAQELGVNPNTVQKAYQMLERDGIIYSVPGKGSFVSGGEAAILQQKEIAMKKLEEAVLAAADCGVKASEILDTVHAIYNGMEE